MIKEIDFGCFSIVMCTNTADEIWKHPVNQLLVISEHFIEHFYPSSN